MSKNKWLIVITWAVDKLPKAVLRWTAQVEHLSIEDSGMFFLVRRRRYVESQLVSEDAQRISITSTDLMQTILLMSLRKAADSGFVLYRHSSQIFRYCRETLLSSKVPYGIWFDNDVNFNWGAQHFIANSRIRLCFRKKTLDQLRNALVYDCERFKSNGILPKFDEMRSRQHQHPDFYLSAEMRKEAPRKALLISYYMPPAETVAVHRINYWEKMLPKIALERKDPALEVTALTAVHSHKTNGDYLFVQDDGGLSCQNGETIELVDRMKAERVNFFSVFWADKIREMFEQNPNLRYDSVVMSGNPFFYFSLGEYFKRKWGATIILDFRDPFANNPRFKYTEGHKDLVVELERGYISDADYAISVNKYCLDALELDDPKKGAVVANGFDERVVDVIEPIELRDNDGRMNFVYTGSFYADRDPEPFLASLDESLFRLIHIGRVQDADAHLDQYPGITRYGLMSYEDVIGYCKSMDVGVIFTSGAPFEQTTKIFDYIAASLSILIVTDGEPNTGELENLTGKLSNVFWVRNNQEAIKAFLDDFNTPRRKKNGRDRFSRKAQTEILYNLIVS